MAKPIFDYLAGKVLMHDHTGGFTLLKDEIIQLSTDNPSDAGEILRLDFLDTTEPTAKAIMAFRDEDGDSKAWLVAHNYLSYPDNQHAHFSIEISDSTGALQSRLTFPYDQDISEATFNQVNLTINRNTGETNGNLTFGGGGGGGTMRHVGNFSMYPESSSNATYFFKVSLEGVSNNQLTIAAGGSSTLYVGDDLYVGTKNIITDTSTGTKIGTATSQKLGFFNVTPVVQQAYTAISNPPTQAEVTVIRNALVNLGLMASS